MSIINKYKIFKELDQKFVINIKLFYLTKLNLLFVTLDNIVFNYSLNSKQLKKIESICENQVIIKFDCSYSYYYTHYLALTDNGCVYSWGKNSYGQLGDGSDNDCEQPKLIKSLCDITDIICGAYHSLVLSRCGDVYAFGYNWYGQCGNISRANQLIPHKIILSNTSINVSAISCGGWHSVALTENGNVFGWGLNGEGELGIKATDKQLTPYQLNERLVKQIVCGNSYTMWLTSDGDIYFCGHIIDCLWHTIPTQLNSSTKFIKISSPIHSDLCVALSQNNKCFIFGKYGKHPNVVIIKDLRETDFSSIKKTYAYYEQITPKCVIIKQVEKITNYANSFKELSLINSGGFSSVFKCEHILSHKLYAIKKISFEPKDEQIVLNELNILYKLSFNFVVKYYTSWVEDNYYLESNGSDSDAQNRDLIQLFYSPLRTHLLHIQMELCSLTLRDAINTIVNECKTATKTLSLIGYYVSSELLFEILECVQYLHQQNPAIIHRDLKPENILLTNLNNNNNRFVKLSDFGLSTYHKFNDQSHTKYKGTKFYKAPELNFTTKYSTPVDIYSLGVIIMELFQIDASDKIKELNEVKTLALSALNATPELRPDCNQLLSQHNKWRLLNKKLSSSEEFIQIIHKTPHSSSIEDNFIEYFIQNKYVRNNSIAYNRTDSFSSAFKSFLKIK